MLKYDHERFEVLKNLLGKHDYSCRENHIDFDTATNGYASFRTIGWQMVILPSDSSMYLELMIIDEDMNSYALSYGTMMAAT
ncbi:MAG: hypothetical protein CMB97_05265 [Flavobacteriaceae bacterium]|nr:hypothetical protein [Flavobacteriaceae bacterium]